MSHVVSLFLAGSLAAAALFIGLLVRQMATLPHSGKPVVEEPKRVRGESPPMRQTIVVIDARKEHSEIAEKAHVPVSEPEEKATVAAPSHRREPLTADQIFEQRLQAGEDDLRRQLCDVPELRLLADEDVRDFRDKEKVARMNARNMAKMAFKSQSRQGQSAFAGVGGGRIGRAIAAEERAMQRAVAAQQRAAVAAQARNMRVAASRAADERVVAEFNQTLQQNMRQAAARAGLTLQSGPRCQLAANVAASVAELSNDLRRLGFVSALRRTSLPQSSPSTAELPIEQKDIDGPTARKTRAFQIWCDQKKLERLSGTVPTLTQMLQIEEEPTRLLLVRELARVPSAASTIELADRALMDLSPEVRRAAVAALSQRRTERYVPILTKGLRYPWPPVADHAADALRTLQPQGAVLPLVDLLDLRSPSLPAWDARTHKYVQRELVRLNHLRNCLLCHAVSTNKEDGLVRGLVPTPGMPLRSAAGGNYYSGDGDNVRADITYLRQDFSVKLLDQDVAPWPTQQRYDFVTRLRTVSPDVAAELSASSLSNYPQREAVLYALRGLTGKDGGESSAKWRELLGIARDNPPKIKDDPLNKSIAPKQQSDVLDR